MHKLFIGDIPEDITLTGSLAIDTETLGLNIKRDALCLVQIADSLGNVVLVKFEDGVYNAPNLKRLIEDENRLKIFHYGRFDIPVLMNALGINKISPVFCTKIASKLVRTYTDHHGLKTICRELLSTELDKESQSSNWAARHLTEKQIKYAINDVIFLHKLKAELTAMLHAKNRMHLAEGCFSFLHTVAQLELCLFDANIIISH